MEYNCYDSWIHNCGKIGVDLPEEVLLQGRPTWAEISLDNLAHNIRVVRKILKPETLLMAVVKADAYGHGAEETARLALAEGCQWLGVALPEEGIELRLKGIDSPILVMGPVALSAAPLFVQYNLTPTIYSWELAEAFSEEAARRGISLKVHIKVDTGMGRLGFPFYKNPVEAVEKVAALPGLEIEGLYTHFSSADEPEEDFTLQQWLRFQNIITSCQEKGITIKIPHAANSGGILKYPQSHASLVRLGISLYGCLPSFDMNIKEVDLKPVLSLKSRLTFIKEVPPCFPVSYGRSYYTKGSSVLATVPIGYADGLSRHLSNTGFALVKGKRVPIVGRVCMDQTILDVSSIPEARIEDEVVFYGSQGKEAISVDEVAGHLGTISYEVLCSVGKRVPRAYTRGKTYEKVRSFLQ